MTSLPHEFIERLKLLYRDRSDTVLASFSTQKPVTIRVNALRASINQFIETLKQYGIKFKKVNWVENALIVETNNKSLTVMQEYKDGWFYIQSLSSLIPALALNPQPGERILDMAAAPGSKTTHMATLMKNTGSILANDVSGERIFKLKSNCDRLCAINITTSRLPGQILWQKYPGHFDRILVDVPCSMEGLFNTGNPKTITHWSLKKVKNLAKLQRLMLRSAVGCLKPGGTLIYSTCTLSPEENEEVVDWVLRRESGKLIIDEIMIPGLDMIDGLTRWGNKGYNNDLAKTKRIIPDGLMEGFYIAKFMKIPTSNQQDTNKSQTTNYKLQTKCIV